MLVVINTAGPVHTVFTITGTSTTGLNSTVQVRVTSDPTGWMGLTGSLEITTIGIGTGIGRYHHQATQQMLHHWLTGQTRTGPGGSDGATE